MMVVAGEPKKSSLLFQVHIKVYRQGELVVVKSKPRTMLPPRLHCYSRRRFRPSK